MKNKGKLLFAAFAALIAPLFIIWSMGDIYVNTDYFLSVPFIVGLLLYIIILYKDLKKCMDIGVWISIVSSLTGSISIGLIWPLAPFLISVIFVAHTGVRLSQSYKYGFSPPKQRKTIINLLEQQLSEHYAQSSNLCKTRSKAIRQLIFCGFSFSIGGVLCSVAYQYGDTMLSVFGNLTSLKDFFYYIQFIPFFMGVFSAMGAYPEYKEYIKFKNRLSDRERMQLYETPIRIFADFRISKSVPLYILMIAFVLFMAISIGLESGDFTIYIIK